MKKIVWNVSLILNLILYPRNWCASDQAAKEGPVTQIASIPMIMDESVGLLGKNEKNRLKQRKDFWRRDLQEANEERKITDKKSKKNAVVRFAPKEKTEGNSLVLENVIELNIEDDRLDAFRNNPDKYIKFLQKLDKDRFKFISPEVFADTLTQINFDRLFEHPEVLEKLDAQQLQAINSKRFKTMSSESFEELLQNSEILKKLDTKQLQSIDPDMFSGVPKASLKWLFDHPDILSKFSDEQRKLIDTERDAVKPDDMLNYLHSRSNRYIEYLKNLDKNRFKFISPEVFADTLTQITFDKLLQNPEILKKFDTKQLQAINSKMFKTMSWESFDKLLQNSEILKKFDTKQLQSINPYMFSEMSEASFKSLFEHSYILSKFSKEQLGSVDPNLYTKVSRNH